MLSLDKINETILELTQSDTSFATCEKLASLYIVKDHLTAQLPAAKVGRMAGSEFLQAASGVDVEALLGLLDEHMQVIHTIYPDEYKEIVRRLNGLKGA